MSSYAWDIARCAGALAIICLFIGGIYLLVKNRIGSFPQTKSERINVTAYRRLSPKHALWLVNIDDKEHIVATADEGAISMHVTDGTRS